MATFNIIWSIDLGKSSLKAVKLRRERNNVEILAIDKIDYPVGTNGVDTVQHARDALTAFKQRNEVRDPVVVAHPGQGTFSRFIKVPAFEAKKLKEMVGYEASQQIPFPLDEVIWDYHLINRQYQNGEEREVGIFAVRKEAIDDYLLDFTSEGLAVEMLSIGYLGLLNYIFYEISPPEPSIVVDIGATHTDLILVDSKKFWIRALPHSGNDVNKAIMERFKVSFQEAEKLKVDSGKAPQQAVKIFSAVIQPKLKDLVGEIHRSVGYYRSQNGEVKFQNLYLLGNGSRIIGIKKYLQEQLGLQVHRPQTLQHFRVNREVDLKLLQNELPAFATAFGCGLQGVGAGNCQVDLVPQEEKVQKEIKRKRKHAFIGFGVVYVAILLGFLIANGKMNDASRKEAGYRAWIRDNVENWEKKAPPTSPAVLEQKGNELQRIAEIRSLVLGTLRALGAVVPRQNEQTEVMKEVAPAGDTKKKSQAEAAVKEKVAELNRQRLWIPYLKIERIDWPEGAAEAREKGVSKKSIPTVPAYKVTVLAAVAVQSTEQESLALLRKLLEEPLERKLKEIPQLTIDTDVKVSQNYYPEMKQLYYKPSTRAGGAAAAAEPVGGRVKQDDTGQEAGPFFGTEVSWYLRLREPKEEVVPVVAKQATEDEDTPKTKDKKKQKPK